MAVLPKTRRFFVALLSNGGIFWFAIFEFFFIFLAYRIRLYFELTYTTSKAAVWEFGTRPPPFHDLIAYSASDFYVAAAIGIVFQFLALGIWLLNWRGYCRLARILIRVLYCTLILLAFIAAGTAAACHRVLFETALGLNTYFVVYFLTSLTTDPHQVSREIMSWTAGIDLLFITLIPIAGMILYRLFRPFRIYLHLSLLLAGIVTFICAEREEAYFKWVDQLQAELGDKFDMNKYPIRKFEEIRINPVYQVADIFYWYFTRPLSKLEKREVLPNTAQQQAISFTDPIFVDPAPVPAPIDNRSALAAGPPIRNVVFFLIESGSHLQMIDQGPEVMPFTTGLMKRSISSRKHYTTMGITTEATTSIFTGLYPSNFNFDKSGWEFPTLFNFLQASDPNYDLLWVTSGSFRGFFPAEMLMRDNSLKVWDLYSLPETKDGPQSETYTRDEIKTFDFFLQSLAAQPPDRPIGAVYYYYSTHYPYFNFGPKEDYLRQDVGGNLNRYVNALHLADKLIQKLLKFLEQTGRLENTVVVITGDHGESFGAEPFHGTQTTDDVLQTPLIIYNPHLKPYEIPIPTSHVDILPSVLDALEIPYNPQLFHGESLLQPVQKRRYVMSANYYMDTAFIDKSGNKSVFKYMAGLCDKFTSEEISLGDCENGGPEFDAGLAFRNYLNLIIPLYNNTLRESRPFFGQAHSILERRQNGN